jgi:hypothetical protein
LETATIGFCPVFDAGPASCTTTVKMPQNMTMAAVAATSPFIHFGWLRSRLTLTLVPATQMLALQFFEGFEIGPVVLPTGKEGRRMTMR